MPGEQMASVQIKTFYVSEIAKIISGGCRYRLFLNSPPNNSSQELMPIYPQAVIGQVYHEIFKEITDGLHSEDDIFRLIISRCEELAINYNKSGKLLQIPNFNTAIYLRDFKKKASGLEERKRFLGSRRSGKNFFGFGREIRVHGFDEKVVGRIDEVSKFNEKIIIIDDKSGQKINQKIEYKNQLFIYALLWSQMWNQAVDSIMLRDEYGKTIWEEEVSRFQLDKFNTQILEILLFFEEHVGSEFELANPTHDNCRFCEHRIHCIPHKKLENIMIPDEACFFSGSIIKKFELPGSKMKLTIRIDGKLYQTTVDKSSITIDKTELPIDAEFHAFFLDSNSDGRINPRTQSYRIIAK